MALYRYTIPITDYYGEEVFFQNLYFEKNSCPTFTEVEKYLELRVDRLQAKQNTEWYDGVSLGAHKELLDIVRKAQNDWPSLHDNLIMTNTHVQHPKFGKQPLSVKLIQPVIL